MQHARFRAHAKTRLKVMPMRRMVRYDVFDGDRHIGRILWTHAQ